MEWPGKSEDVEQEIYLNFVDYDYIDVFEIDLVEGRNFSRDNRTDEAGAFLLNESAVKAIGWDSAVGKEFTHFMGRRRGRVVGVVKDFHMLSLHDPIHPLCIDLDLQEDFRQLSIQIRGDNPDDVIHLTRQTLSKVNPDYPFVCSFLEEIYDADYRAELKVQSLLDICTLLAVFVACLGLLGLSALTVERRTKEIGVRKILGASGTAIVVMVSKQMTRWILVSNLIAWPVSYLILRRWLQEFTFRTNLSLILFLGAGIMAFIVGAFTVSVQALKAARSNPVDVLRYE
jgi:putative ABC transport system permease protein